MPYLRGAGNTNEAVVRDLCLTHGRLNLEGKVITGGTISLEVESFSAAN